MWCIIYEWYKESILIFPENTIMVLWRLLVCIYTYIHLILHNNYIVCIYIYMYILFGSMLKSGKWRWRVQLWPPEELHTFVCYPQAKCFHFPLGRGIGRRCTGVYSLRWICLFPLGKTTRSIFCFRHDPHCGACGMMVVKNLSLRSYFLGAIFSGYRWMDMGHLHMRSEKKKQCSFGL